MFFSLIVDIIIHSNRSHILHPTFYVHVHNLYMHVALIATHHVHVGDECRGRIKTTLMRSTDLLQVALLDTQKQMLQNKGEVNCMPGTLSAIAYLPLGMPDEAPSNQLWQQVSYHSYQQRVYVFQGGPPLMRTALYPGVIRGI